MSEFCPIDHKLTFLSRYGTEWLAKSLTFVWALIGTKPYYHVDEDSHGKILKELAEMIDNGSIKCHHQQTLPLTLDGLRKAHEQVEASGVMGKIGLSVDVKGLEAGKALM